jgi:flagellar assembly protein FliH
MSIDVTFSPASFPALRDAEQLRAETDARNHGQSIGYAIGLRTAALELAAQRAAIDAEHQAMMREGQERIDQAVGLLAVAAQALNDRAIPLQEQAQATLVSSALDLAEAVLEYELSDGHNSSRTALARVLRHVDPATVVTVRMNPSDLVMLDRASLDGANVELTPDPLLQRGDAIADFAEGYLDARIGSALGRARAALLGESS